MFGMAPVLVYGLDQRCQTESQEGRSVCRFLWFPFNQLSIKACRPRCVHSLANQWLEWTKGAENNQKTSRHSGPPGLEFDTCGLDEGYYGVVFTLARYCNLIGFYFYSFNIICIYCIFSISGETYEETLPSTSKNWKTTGRIDQPRISLWKDVH